MIRALDKNFKRKYLFSEYNPDWSNQFQAIKKSLQEIFGSKAVAIEHVGSTSIPGMSAKPIIDVLVIVRKMEDFTAEKKRMVESGYEWGENYIAPNTLIFFKLGPGGEKIQNIHVCEENGPKIKQFIVMRDFFRAFPAKAKAYSDLKIENASKYPDDYPAYRAAKIPFLDELEQEAYAWKKNGVRSEKNGSKLKVAYLFTKIRTGATISRNHFYGMYELRDHGFDARYLELEQYLPKRVCDFLRRYFLNMHFAHLPLFPLFFKYDVIFSSTGYASLVLKNLLHIKKFKWVILDFNILGTIGEGKTLKQKIFRWAVARADGIVTISDLERRGLEEAFPRLRGKVVFIHEATDMDLFRQVQSSKIKDQRNGNVETPQQRLTPVVEGELSLEASDYILSVGTYGRDFDTLVQVAKETGRKVILATKPGCVAHLRPLPPNVTANLFKSHEMPALYAGASAVVIGLAPNGDYDSVGTLSLGEAFAMGAATVVSETESMRSYVEDGENALFVPLRDAGALKAALSRLDSDPTLAARLGANARKYAEEHLTLERFADALAPFLRRIVA